MSKLVTIDEYLSLKVFFYRSRPTVGTAFKTTFLAFGTGFCLISGLIVFWSVLNGSFYPMKSAKVRAFFLILGLGAIATSWSPNVTSCYWVEASISFSFFFFASSFFDLLFSFYILILTLIIVCASPPSKRPSFTSVPVSDFWLITLDFSRYSYPSISKFFNMNHQDHVVKAASFIRQIKMATLSSMSPFSPI